jgi:hypothetical protein
MGNAELIGQPDNVSDLLDGLRHDGRHRAG